MKVVNMNQESYDVCIDRTSKWGNPYSHKRGTLAKHVVSSREEAIESYRRYITEGEGKWLLEHLGELENKVLGCHCKPKACHGDVLLGLVNQKLLKDIIGNNK